MTIPRSPFLKSLAFAIALVAGAGASHVADKVHSATAKSTRAPVKTAAHAPAAKSSKTAAAKATPAGAAKEAAPAEKKPADEASKAAPGAPAAHAAAPIRGTAQASATVALARLIAGNERFVSGRPEHPHQDAVLLRTLAAGQKPQVIVLSCADSRVPPELVFDQGLGDLFVVRVAGNTLDASTVASVEYAVEHLGAPLLVVLGHHGCGAVKAALTTAPKAGGSPDLGRLLATIRPGIQRFAGASAKDPTLDGPVRANVDASVAGLLLRSAIVRERHGKGLVTVVPGVYILESGRVEYWDAVAPQASVPEKR